MRRPASALGLAVCFVALSAPRSVPPERVVRPGATIASTVNGAPGRLRVMAAETRMPLLSPDWAGRAGLKPSFLDIGARIGPVTIYGHSVVARIDLGQGATKRRVGWLRRYSPPGFDGAVGPGGVREPVVRFVLRDAVPGERTASFPTAEDGGRFLNWSELFAVVEIGGEPMRVLLDPDRARSTANAGAGARLRSAQGGRFEGEVGREMIAYGVERPVRRLRLDRPLAIGALRLSAIMVREAAADPVGADGEPAPPDPNEIVVTGRRERDRSKDRITLGADVLSRCSAITFDKSAKRVHLTCA